MTKFELIISLGARRRLLTLALLVVISLLALPGLLFLRVDTSQNSLINPNDPAKQVYDRVVERFGSDYMTLVFLSDPALFTVEKLPLAENLHYRLAGLDFVQKVESLFTTANIRSVDGALDTTPLMDMVPATQEEVEQVRLRARDNPFVVDNMMGKNGDAMVIVVKIQPDWSDSTLAEQAYDQVENLIAPLRSQIHEVFQIGPPRIIVGTKRGVDHDMRFLTPIAALLLILGIILFLRSASTAFLPLITSGLSILWTMGLLGHLGVPLNMLSSGLPLLLIAVGSTEDTHMIGAYFRSLGKDDGENRAERRSRAVAGMVRKVGVATIVTAATTAVGFASSIISPLRILNDFGIATASGMVFNLVATVLVVPLVLRTMGPLSTRLVNDDSSPRGIFVFVQSVSFRLLEHHWRKILGVVLVISVAGIGLGSTLTPNNDPMSYLKHDNPIVADTETMHREVSGIQAFFITFDGRSPGFFLEPKNLKVIEEVGRYIRQSPDFDQVLSLADLVSYVNREWTTGADDAYRVPDDRMLIEQYLLFFQRGDIENYATAKYDSAAMTIRHNLFDSVEIDRAVDRLRKRIDAISGGRVPYEIVSQNILINRASDTLVQSQIISFCFVILVIFVIISLMYSSVRLGLASLVPNILPALAVFGLMAALDMPLNPGTILVAVVALGIAVDDTIHLTTSYSRLSRTIRDPAEAARQAISSQVVAVVTTSVSLCASFLVFLLSDFAVLSQFGLLCAIALAVAVLADLWVTPIFLRFVRLVSIWDILALDVGIEAVKASPLLKGMSTFQIKKTLLLCELASFGVGVRVIAQGQSDENMYMMLDGTAGVWRKDDKGIEHFVSALFPGDVFGEVGFVGPIKRTADIRAISDIRVLRLNAQDVEHSLRLYPHIATKLYRNIGSILGQRLSHTMTTLDGGH